MHPVLINNKLAVTQASNCRAYSTDPCYAGNPVSIINFTNMASCEYATPVAHSVLIHGKPLCHHNSVITISHGDEASYGGIYSGTTQGRALFLSSSPNVLAEGHPAVREGDSIQSNNGNALRSFIGVNA